MAYSRKLQGDNYSRHTRQLHARRLGSKSLPTLREVIQDHPEMRIEIKRRVDQKQRQIKKSDDEIWKSLKRWKQRQEELERLIGY